MAPTHRVITTIGIVACIASTAALIYMDAPVIFDLLNTGSNPSVQWAKWTDPKFMVLYILSILGLFVAFLGWVMSPRIPRRFRDERRVITPTSKHE